MKEYKDVIADSPKEMEKITEQIMFEYSKKRDENVKNE